MRIATRFTLPAAASSLEVGEALDLTANKSFTVSG